MVRDLLTTEHEQRRRAAGVIEIDSLRPDAAVVDAVAGRRPTPAGPAGPDSCHSPRRPCVLYPRFLKQMASYDAAINIYQVAYPPRYRHAVEPTLVY